MRAFIFSRNALRLIEEDDRRRQNGRVQNGRPDNQQQDGEYNR